MMGDLPSQPKATILVVDDEAAVRRVLVMRLLEPLLERAEPRHRAVELAAAVVDLLAQRGVVLLER